MATAPTTTTSTTDELVTAMTTMSATNASDDTDINNGKFQADSWLINDNEVVISYKSHEICKVSIYALYIGHQGHQRHQRHQDTISQYNIYIYTVRKC